MTCLIEERDTKISTLWGTAIEQRNENEGLVSTLGAKEMMVGVNSIINCLIGIIMHC